MNIIDSIKESILNNPNDHLNIRDEHKILINAFLEKPGKNAAKKLFEFISEVQKKNEIFSRLSELLVYEDSFKAIIPNHKDHYFHSASVYVLGLALYNNMPILREMLKIDRFRNATEENEKQKSAFLWSWSIAACLHDIGYPFELSINSFNNLTAEYYTKEKKYVSINTDIINEKMILPPLGRNIEYANLDTAFKIIANRMKYGNQPILSMDTLVSYMTNYYSNSLINGDVDHGMISSLIVINDLYSYYKTKDINIDRFYQEMADAGTAIFLHNFYKYSKLPEYCGLTQYSIQCPNTLGCLLFVCDTICEWFRKDKSNVEDFNIENSGNFQRFIIDKKHEKSMKSSTILFDQNYFAVDFI